MNMMIIKTVSDCEEWTPLTDQPLPYFPDWDEVVEAYPDEEDEDEQDIEQSVS